jgi:hypothetical protein
LKCCGLPAAALLWLQAGTKSVGKAQLAAQLEVWRGAGMDAYVAPAMHDVYALLAGDVDGVTPQLMAQVGPRLLGSWAQL